MAINPWLVLLICAFGVLFPPLAFGEENFIQITGDRVNIRTNTTTSSTIVAKALKDDVFRLSEEKDQWWEIYIFSGEARYIYKSLADIVDYQVSLPSPESTRRELFKAFLQAEDRATAEADRKYPLADQYGRPISGNINKNIDYQRMLNDRYKLEITHSFGIQPPIYTKIAIEGVQKSWWK